MNAQFPQGVPPYGGGVPGPPKRGLGAGWVIAIVAVGAVVVVGVAAGAFALLGNGREVDGKYGSTPLASCDDVASRVGDLPPKSSETKIGPNKGWGAASPTRRTP